MNEMEGPVKRIHRKPKPQCHCNACRSCRTRRLWQDGKYRGRSQPPPWNAWDPEESDVIRRYAGRLDVASIAAKASAVSGVPRTESAIKNRAGHMGLSIVVPDLSMRDVAALFGTRQPSILRWWVAPGYLRGHQDRYSWHFTRAAMEAFIRGFPWAYAVESMTPGHPLTSLAQVVNGRDPWMTAGQLGRLVGVVPATIREYVARLGLPSERRFGVAGHGEMVVQSRHLGALMEAARNPRRPWASRREGG